MKTVDFIFHTVRIHTFQSLKVFFLTNLQLYPTSHPWEDAQVPRSNVRVSTVVSGQPPREDLLCSASPPRARNDLYYRLYLFITL